MKVHVEPTGLYSRAMVRIADALKRFAPPGIEFVDDRDNADTCVYYVIGEDFIPEILARKARGQRVVAVQCCLKTASKDPSRFLLAWQACDFVWSYYDLRTMAQETAFRFYHAPLGLDDAFYVERPELNRLPYILTSGYVSGPGCEAIKEVWDAAADTGYKVYHLGPSDVVDRETGEPIPLDNYRHVIFGQPDDRIYSGVLWQCEFVAAMRYVEGFELPAAEGLACGARPLMFPQGDIKHWYGDLPTYVTERSGAGLVHELKLILGKGANHREMTQDDKMAARRRFDWIPICKGFWESLLAWNLPYVTTVAEVVL